MRNLDLTEMENIEGGYQCAGLGAGLSGASAIFGIASWWTGVGGLLSIGLGVAGMVASYYCGS